MFLLNNGCYDAWELQNCEKVRQTIIGIGGNMLGTKGIGTGESKKGYLVKIRDI